MTDREAARVVSQEVVTALYDALLGHPPDAAGLAHWQSARSVRDVVEGLTATGRFRDRVLTLAGRADPAAGLAQAAWRLVHGRGLVELVDVPPTSSQHTVLEALPWDEVCAGVGGREVQVIGRYAAELADEMRRRQVATDVTAGVVDDGVHPGGPDILVLTAGEDLPGIQWGSPQLLRAVRRRIMLPIRVDVDRPVDEVVARRTAVRSLLHSLGFTEVHQLFRRRFGGGVQRIDTSYSTPDPGVLRTVGHHLLEPALVPRSTWFVANRAPDEMTS